MTTGGGGGGSIGREKSPAIPLGVGRGGGEALQGGNCGPPEVPPPDDSTRRRPVGTWSRMNSHEEGGASRRAEAWFWSQQGHLYPSMRRAPLPSAFGAAEGGRRQDSATESTLLNLEQVDGSDKGGSYKVGDLSDDDQVMDDGGGEGRGGDGRADSMAPSPDKAFTRMDSLVAPWPGDSGTEWGGGEGQGKDPPHEGRQSELFARPADGPNGGFKV